MSAVNPPSGWYDRPDRPGAVGYWDGEAWLETPVSPPLPKETPQWGLVITGYVMAVIIPIVGFILGIVTITRPNKATSKHGVWIVVLSVAVFFISIVIIVAAAASSSPSPSY